MLSYLRPPCPLRAPLASALLIGVEPTWSAVEGVIVEFMFVVILFLKSKLFLIAYFDLLKVEASGDLWDDIYKI